MKPIGTVTKYYPLVDDETRTALDSLIHESENFYDFLVQLGETVCSEEAPLSLSFLAAYWSWRGEVAETEDRIVERYKDTPIIRPWTFPRVNNLVEAQFQPEMVKALDYAISSEPEDWILMHLHFRKMSVQAGIPEAMESYEAAKKIVDDTPKLECFRADILYREGHIRDREGDARSAMELYQDALERAREQDDPWLVGNIQLSIGKRIALTDFQKGMELVDDAYRISRNLAIPVLVKGPLDSMASISHNLGEYDLALKSIFEAAEPITSPKFPRGHFPLDISMIYSDIGDGNEALNWASMYDYPEGKGGPSGLSVHGCPDTTFARALLLLNRTSEASKHIDSLKEKALKSGWEPWLADFYLVSGQYEIAVGEIANGMELIQHALEIYERLDRQTSTNRALIALTKAEILGYKQDVSIPDPRDSGPWMTRLEKEATEKRLTGILMQLAMLKAEFRMKLKQVDAARDTLESALAISDQPSVKTLREQILSQLKELARVSPS